MAKSLAITASSKPVRAYYASLRAFSRQGVKQEQAVRSAFQQLLADFAKPLKWTAIPEHGKKVRGKRIYPDGTLKDQYRLTRGYWEAKDTADDLDAEIAAKRRKGYPLNNTIFWTPSRAVLFQDGRQVHDLHIDEADGNPGHLCDILTAFFAHTTRVVVDFDEAVDTFKERVPEVGGKLAEIIAEAHKSLRPFQQAFAKFFDLCRTTLNPHISREAVDEMLVQHLLTARLFKSVFDNPEFLRMNVIAVEVEKVIDALASRSFNRDDFLASLDHFYVAIENAAAKVHDWSGKQDFLNTIYERFFQGYCVKTADTHGIVYTPQEIVDFMCASVEWVLDTEFGKKLGDDGVNILDPCTGTGNFVVNLIRRAADHSTKRLQRLYREQVFANEIMLMPYYIAALNIEHEFFEHTGGYEPFEGLCFVDTLELAEPKHSGLFTEDNLRRVERQKNAPIEVVIGNPPYNVGQMVHNERNQNRPYPVVDAWVKHSYAKDSKATSVSKLNDPYVKFFRWATKRLEDRDGVVCFVSNNAFLENIAYDGMRKHLARDFQTIYHLDLEGNVRQNPTLSGTQYNVFGIQVGVGVTVCVKRRGTKGKGIQYANVRKDMPRADKLALIDRLGSVEHVKWKHLKPDPAHNWIVAPNAARFASFVPIASKEARSAKNGPGGVKGVIFKDYSLGIATHRDSVVYDFSKERLAERVKAFIEAYNTEVDRWKRAPAKADVNQWVKYDQIAWDRDLKNDLKRGRYVEWNKFALRSSLYRPFARRWVYFDRILCAEVYGLPNLYPTQETENRVLGFSGLGHRAAFASLCALDIPNLSILSLDGFQWCSQYLYDADGLNRRHNVTDWALDLFRRQFAAEAGSESKAKRISKEDIFHYVYGVLHHPVYREAFADSLRRELPRIPMAKSFDDFRAFVKAGERLADLHLHYDDTAHVKPYPLKQVWHTKNAEGRNIPKSYRVEDRMKLSKESGTLSVNPSLTLEGIPQEVYGYRLGNRSALEWVVDQYRVETDETTEQVSDCNAWGDEREDEEYVVRLVKQVVTVSLETMKIVDGLPADFGGPPCVEDTFEPQSPPAENAAASSKFRSKPGEKTWELKAERAKPAQRRLRPPKTQ